MKKDAELAYLVLRVALGFDIALHGLVRICGHYTSFVESTVQMFASSPLPEWSVRLSTEIIPFAEAVIGVFLFLGLFTRFTALVGALLMLQLIFGMSLLQKWEIVGLQMMYVFWYYLLIAHASSNRWSLDHYWQSRTDL
jgi:thiosulfate dehydrogenase [quinone] large subunit